MRRVSHRFSSIAIIAGVGLAALACGSDSKVGVRCGDFIAPGTVVLKAGVAISVHNDQGQSIAQGASVVLLGRTDSTAQTFVRDSATVWVFVGAGAYWLRVSKPLYQDTTLNDVVVQNDDCGNVQTTQVAVTLHPLPAASTVRSLSIFGASFLDQPGAVAHLAAIVDAAPGVSRAVVWRTDDPALVSTDQNGGVIARCSTRGGTATVTAHALADPSVSAVVRLAVAPADSC